MGVSLACRRDLVLYSGDHDCVVRELNFEDLNLKNGPVVMHR